MPEAFINRIATATPPHDVHDTFLRFGETMLRADPRRLALFERMAQRCGITHRYSFLEPGRDGAAVDAIATPAAGRRKRLLLADMDSTIVTSETLDEIAAFAGLKERIAEITKRSMNGEMDFRTALIERVGMLAGLPVSALERTWEATALTGGARALVATMRAHGAHCALVSGGFTFFTSRVKDLVGFDWHQSNTLIEADGKLTGKVGEPILDRDAKLAALTRMAAEQGLPLEAALTVGDGANDLAMIQAAGLGVAFRAKPVVAAAARAKLDHADLRGLLFAQGYRAAEIVAG
jgi:phosphoserine phosphatase